MWMTDSVRAIKRGLRDEHGWKQIGGTDEDPLLEPVDDGTYKVTVNGTQMCVNIEGGNMHILPSSNTKLREASGSVDLDSKFVSFLYSLMRDHLPCGAVEQLVNDSLYEHGTAYTNGFLAQYAQHLAERLK